MTLVAAMGASASGPTQVSGTSSPYGTPACIATDQGQTGRNYVDAEVEPQLAISRDGSNLVATWHQDRWSNGGAHGIAGAFSTDGGANWSQTTLPFSACASGGLGYQRASDPWQSIGPDGTIYVSALSFDNSDGRNAVSGAISTNGGKTWQNAQTIVAYDTNQNSTDKNATTADPVHPGVAYTVWDTLTAPTDQPDDHPHAAAYSGPAFFSKTTNGGVSWSTPTVIIGTGNRQQTIGNAIVIGIDPKTHAETLYDFTDLIVPPNKASLHQIGNEEVAVAKSTDGGNNWSTPVVISPFNSMGVIDPNTGAPLRVGDGLAEAAVDPNTGQLYVVWESATNFTTNLNSPQRSWDDEILLSTSVDQGATWSTPTVVHHLASGLPTFTPTVAVNSQGTVAVTYYDNRYLQPTQTANLPTDYWANFSTDHGATFSATNEVHLAGPFDTATAPVARGFFLGDYEGLQASGSKFWALFVKTTCDGTLSNGSVTFPPPVGFCAAPDFTTRSPHTTNTNPTDVFVEQLAPPGSSRGD